MLQCVLMASGQRPAAVPGAAAGAPPRFTCGRSIGATGLVLLPGRRCGSHADVGARLLPRDASELVARDVNCDTGGRWVQVLSSRHVDAISRLSNVTPDFNNKTTNYTHTRHKFHTYM